MTIGELPDDERLDMVDDLVSQSERAQRIVRNLLDFARESEIEADAHEVQDIIEDTLRLATNQIKLAKVKVKGELAPNLPPIYGDRQQLQQVFLNIVLNALDAMPEGRNSQHILQQHQRSGTRCAWSSPTPASEYPNTGSRTSSIRSSRRSPAPREPGLDFPSRWESSDNTAETSRCEVRLAKGTTFSVLLPVAKVPADIPDDDRDVE